MLVNKLNIFLDFSMYAMHMYFNSMLKVLIINFLAIKIQC